MADFETAQGNAAPTKSGHITRESSGDEDVKPADILSRLGLDLPTFIVLLKGSLPPTVAIAMYQSSVVSGYFLTFGYFIAIASFLALPVLHRGKFVVHLSLCALSVCVAAAASLLTIWSALRARSNTSTTSSYNSSQNAVSAIVMADCKHLPTVGSLFHRNQRRLYRKPYIYYHGSRRESGARASCVHVGRIGTGRRNEFASSPNLKSNDSLRQTKRMIGLLQDALRKQKAHLRSIESEGLVPVSSKASAPHARMAGQEQIANEAMPISSFKGKNDALLKLAGELRAETEFAQWDITYGKLDGNDLEHIFKLLRGIMVPIVGMGQLMNLFQSISERRHWIDDKDLPAKDLAAKEIGQKTWNSIIAQIRGAFGIVSDVVNDGLQHAAFALEILLRPKSSKALSKEPSGNIDVEAQCQLVKPEDPSFAENLDKRIKAFHEQKSQILRTWATEKGFSADDNISKESDLESKLETPAIKDRAQLYILLFLEKMMHSTVEAVQDFVSFADGKVQSGKMKRSRLILPSKIKTAVKGILSAKATTGEMPPTVLLGDGYYKKKDPEHRSATSSWQKFGNALRKIPRFLGSQESSCAFRVTCATMTIGIVTYLKRTQHFFQEQRLVWAMVMVAFSMTTTSGQSIFGFFLRIAGTFVGMVFCYIIWYIVDERTTRVVVFLWLFIFITFYFLYKFPRLLMGSALCVITMLLIIGYELQVRKTGKAVAAHTGQPYYPLYSLAPYRLATVAGGMLVAFIWTIFPSPLATDRNWLRLEISSALYLLANYFSAIQETMKTKLREELALESPNSPNTVAYRLQIARETIFSKLAVLVPSIEEHLKFQRWEPTIGGSFPRELYEDILLRSKRIRDYLFLTSYILETRNRRSSGLQAHQSNEKDWLRTFSEIVSDVTPTNHMIISALTLLSNSMRSGQSLPPFVPLPKPFDLTEQLMHRSVEKDSNGLGLLDIRNMEQYGYAEFAIIQVCGTHLRDDLEGIIHDVSSLVGVMDFSWHIESSDSPIDVESGNAVAKDKGKSEQKELA